MIPLAYHIYVTRGLTAKSLEMVLAVTKISQSEEEGVGCAFICRMQASPAPDVAREKHRIMIRSLLGGDSIRPCGTTQTVG